MFTVSANFDGRNERAAFRESNIAMKTSVHSGFSRLSVRTRQTGFSTLTSAGSMLTSMLPLEPGGAMKLPAMTRRRREVVDSESRPFPGYEIEPLVRSNGSALRLPGPALSTDSP
jgi:hypothetical protein